jgi:RNA polymerase sigma-70 factor (ECF subfamily)
VTDLTELIKRCKAHEPAGFELLYKTYYRVLYGIAMRYAKSAAEAEDILQDSFIKVFNSIRNYQAEGSFEGWLKRIVQNTAINSYRSQLRFSLYVDVSEQELLLSDDSSDEIFESLEAKEIVLLLNKMPEGYRLILNLYSIDGYSHKEIAQMMNISEGTSKSQLFKAKKHLKSLLETQSKQKIAG